MSFRVLFVYPNYRSVSLIPPGLALLSRILKNDGIEVELFDTTGYELDPARDYEKLSQRSLAFQSTPGFVSKNVGRNVWNDLNKKIDSFGPSLIGLSCTESNFLLGIEVIQNIKHREVPVILGGIFATSAPLRALSFSEIDMVCVGEGEVTLLELCRRMEQGRSFRDVPGLWLKDIDGSTTKNPLPPLVNLDENPFDFDLGLFDQERLIRPMDGALYRMAPVETARGCPYRCTFCNSPGQPVRKKSLLRVHEELLYYKKTFLVEYMFLWADTFLVMSRRELDEFCELYQDIALPFWIQTRVETVSEEVFKKLQRVGLHRVAFGIENGDEQFRRERMKKMFTNEKAVKKIQIVADLGISHNTNNMVGYPHETREIAMQTVRLNTRFPKADTNCFIFAPYYGTEARNEAVRARFMDPETIAPGNAEDSILTMPQFTKEDIRGFRRCFVLYVKFPESRWPEIRKAENDDELFSKLQHEYWETFFEPGIKF